jgi:hypothetical protein
MANLKKFAVDEVVARLGRKKKRSGILTDVHR